MCPLYSLRVKHWLGSHYVLMTFTRCKQVAMVAIGATMVGSITFSKKEGDVVKKGEQVILLYSQFWWSPLHVFLSLSYQA